MTISCRCGECDPGLNEEHWLQEARRFVRPNIDGLWPWPPGTGIREAVWNPGFIYRIYQQAGAPWDPSVISQKSVPESVGWKKESFGVVRTDRDGTRHLYLGQIGVGYSNGLPGFVSMWRQLSQDNVFIDLPYSLWNPYTRSHEIYFWTDSKYSKRSEDMLRI